MPGTGSSPDMLVPVIYTTQSMVFFVTQAATDRNRNFSNFSEILFMKLLVRKPHYLCNFTQRVAPCSISEPNIQMKVQRDTT
jgi:hypothetical protein